MFDDIAFTEAAPADIKAIAAVEEARKYIEPEKYDPFVGARFEDGKLFSALPENIRENPQVLAQYIDAAGAVEKFTNEARFKKSDNNNTFFGDEVRIPETTHASGRVRRAEEGYKINLDFLAENGVDPAKVLVFRRTQPSDSPKPEYYWTTDYFETQRGLTVEIPASQRATSVILIGDLKTVAGNEGLIQDINDDQGLAVRQIGTQAFDQKLCLGVIRE